MAPEISARADSLLTWFDVERRIYANTRRLTNLPDPLRGVSVYPTGVEVRVAPNAPIASAWNAIAAWFTPAEFDHAKGEKAIHLKIGDAPLPVYLEEAEDGHKEQPLLPLWERLAYLADSIDQPPSFVSPPPLDPSVSLHAFHSFKGGVGRTTALTGFAAAYVSSRKEKVLLVDADLEAPGITYWLTAAQQQSVAFSNLLEALHSPPTDTEQVIQYFADELLKNPCYLDGHEVYLLPAFNSQEELLDKKVAPEHLIRTPESRWILGTALHQIAKKLGSSAVFVDLRAGLSELSSPILFDARFSRFLVSTVAEQSVSGAELTLRMMSLARRALPNQSNARHPSIVLSMVTDQLRSSPTYVSARERLERAYGLAESGPDIEPTRNLASDLPFFEASFSPDLMSIRSLETAFELIKSTRIFADAATWFRPTPPSVTWLSDGASLDDQAIQLNSSASGRVYAEAQVPKGLLTTEALRNLARAFSNEIPNAVLIGAKGSGKTFNYLQIALAGEWSKFLLQLGQEISGGSTAQILPLLKSRELSDANLQSVRRQYEAVQSALSTTTGSSIQLSEIGDQIAGELQKKSSNVTDWMGFWTRLTCRALGFEDLTLTELNERVSQTGKPVVFLVDGIEDALQTIEVDPVQRAAVEAIIELPNRLRDLRGRCLGMLVFVREDYAKIVKSQNFGQFQSRYEKFKLN